MEISMHADLPKLPPECLELGDGWHVVRLEPSPIELAVATDDDGMLCAVWVLATAERPHMLGDATIGVA
jgi:hypothetical protein